VRVLFESITKARGWVLEDGSGDLHRVLASYDDAGTVGWLGKVISRTYTSYARSLRVMVIYESNQSHVQPYGTSETHELIERLFWSEMIFQGCSIT
jgi:hypothetical protein